MRIEITGQDNIYFSSTNGKEGKKKTIDIYIYI